MCGGGGGGGGECRIDTQDNLLFLSMYQTDTRSVQKYQGGHQAEIKQVQERPYSAVRF